MSYGRWLKLVWSAKRRASALLLFNWRKLLLIHDSISPRQAVRHGMAAEVTLFHCCGLNEILMCLRWSGSAPESIIVETCQVETHCCVRISDDAFMELKDRFLSWPLCISVCVFVGLMFSLLIGWVILRPCECIYVEMYVCTYNSNSHFTPLFTLWSIKTKPLINPSKVRGWLPLKVVIPLY